MSTELRLHLRVPQLGYLIQSISSRLSRAAIMPARSNAPAVAAAPTPSVTRFELPALDLKLGSLTDGTDIPPPPPSPTLEKADPVPAPLEATEVAKKAEATNGAPVVVTSGVSPKSQVSITTAGVKRPAEDNPASPTLSARPGSIRRLFSRGLLHSAYANGEETEPKSGRPHSRSNSVAESRKKRSTGWFSRFRSGGSDKTASPLASPTAAEEKKGPPPPMIPELSEIKSKAGIQDDGALGGDLFKDIK